MTYATVLSGVEWDSWLRSHLTYGLMPLEQSINVPYEGKRQ